MKRLEDWLTDEGTYTTVLLAILWDRYGEEFLQWDPVTVNLQLRDDFYVDAREWLLDRVNAGSVLMTTDQFHQALPAFSAICNTLNFGAAPSQLMVPADLDDVFWGVVEARLLEGPEIARQPFAAEIAGYVGVLLSEAGVDEPPAQLSFARLPDHEEGNRQDALATADESFFQVYWEKRQEAKSDYQRAGMQRLQELFAQLAAVPLTNKRADWLKRQQERLAQLVA